MDIRQITQAFFVSSYQIWMKVDSCTFHGDKKHTIAQNSCLRLFVYPVE